MSRGLGDVYKRQVFLPYTSNFVISVFVTDSKENDDCLLYTSPSPRDMRRSRMPSSA
ncbi:hypothetical protein JMUB7527_28630 [Staphylococcus aureus]